MDLPTTFRLNNGREVPAVGLGTFQGDAGNTMVNSYGNEREIGAAIAESDIPRQDIFVTAKLGQTWHEPQDVERALDRSLSDLQLDYVDLYLMHFPHAYKAGDNNATIRHASGNGKPVIDYDLSRRYTETWQAMERLVASGKARSIGLSNFNVLKTKRILEIATIVPAVNQVEMHIYFPQHDLHDFSEKHGILLMAHQPLGGRPVGVVRAHADVPFPTEDGLVVKMAEECGVNPAQLCLSWLVQRGIPVVPKSVQKAHMEENLHLRRLPRHVLEVIDSIVDKRGPVKYLDPSGHLGFDIFDEHEDQPTADEAPWDEV